MEVQFSPEQEIELSRIASRSGTDAAHLVKDAALRLVDEDLSFRAAVREGLIQAERGEFVDDASVLEWLVGRRRS